MNGEQMQEIKPLVIRTQQGKIKDVCLMNQKSYTKSIEQGRLWFLHRDTGRVLPYEGEHVLLDIKSQRSWFEAVTADSEGTSKNEMPAATASPYAASVPDRASVAAGYSAASGFNDAATFKADADFDEDSFPAGLILSNLEYIVRERLQTMPEGSYTSHLFSSGPEKIRKKTGEEAIELILADTPEQMLYEAADLVYHLMVLLVSENLSFDQVCAELQHRHLNG
ncbi:MAG: phosphoribosyl-ATP diphosphatase [Spirochaetota bacterium]|nr:phosphoribosyl-ATP diphosphatase [Spirochaetota bacterium]